MHRLCIGNLMRLRITELRKQRGLSQGDLAAKLGISMSMVGKLERGERRINSDWITRISNAFEVKAADLLDFLEPDADTVQLIGILKRDGSLENIDNDATADATSIDYQLDIQHLASDLPRAIKVESDISLSIPEGSVLMYRAPMRIAGPDMTNRLAMIIIDDLQYPWALGRILPRSVADRYHVLITNGDMLQNAKVRGLFPISEIQMPA